MKTLGIILAGGNSPQMRELTNKRAIAAMPVAGSYRAIDFAMSNMVNSGIGKVAVISQYSSRSLNEHLSSSKWWDFGRKQGGLFLFTPTITPTNSEWYRGTADALAQNLSFLRESHEPYVAIAPGDGICRLDYDQVVEYHIEKDADVTIVCKDMPAGADVSRFGMVDVDADGRIVAFEEKPEVTELKTISCGIYLIRRRLLISLLEECQANNWFDLVRDILVARKDSLKICAYRIPGYWANISTAEAYFECNMDFLKPEVREAFFYTQPEILTKVDDIPPAKYNPGAKVSNALIASGAIVNGEVEGSLLFKSTYVGNGTVIKNSLILKNAHIGDNCVIENCIVEAGVQVPAGSVLKGEGEIKIVTG